VFHYALKWKRWAAVRRNGTMPGLKRKVLKPGVGD